MKQPLWAINSSLLILCILNQLVFLLIYTPVARRASLEPDNIITTGQAPVNTVDIKKIYGVNDLFNTYAPKTVTDTISEPEIPPMPQVPAIIPLSIPIEPPKVFIAQLPVTLKGIIYSQNRPEQSIAIIQFQNSKEEANYHIGDLIIDAQILKIYPNRIIIVRSNGQKETLFLRENDATKDQIIQQAKAITTLQIPIKSGVYQIPIDLFTKQVKSLGQFIDLLDLTTVYKKGKSVGCRIGKAGKDSLATKLGLHAEDIIVQIDNLPITDISSRVLAFDHVTSKTTGSIISVTIERNNHRISMKYELTDTKKANLSSDSNNISSTNPEPFETINAKEKHLLDQKIKLAPTAHQIEIEERKKMMQARQQHMIAQRNTAKDNKLS